MRLGPTYNWLWVYEENIFISMFPETWLGSWATELLECSWLLILVLSISWYPSFQLLSFHTSYWKSCNLWQASIFFLHSLCSQISMCTVMKGPVEAANQTFSLVLGSQARWTLAGCFVLSGFHQEHRAGAFDGSQPVPCTDPSSLWGTWPGRKMYEGFHK